MGWAVTHESVIYCIRCKENGRVYIGRTYRLNTRIREHFDELRRGMKTTYRYKLGNVISSFQEDYNRYGESAFEVYILEEKVQPEDCKSRENYWIDFYAATNPKYGYNRLDEHAKNPLPVPKVGIPPRKEEEHA